MLVDNGLQVDIGGLIFVRRGVVRLQAQLRHAVVGAQGKSIAIDIDPLAQLVITVQGGLSDLHVNAAGLILDVEFPIDVAAPVVGSHLPLDPGVAGNFDAAALVLGLELLDGCEMTAETRKGGFRVKGKRRRFDLSEGQDRIPFLFQTLA